jgi:hypothetical protein
MMDSSFVLSGHRIALVIREVQHCDLQSLRTVLESSEVFPYLDLILEYKSDTSQFEPSHQKLFLRLAGNRRNFHIRTLERLKSGHLEHLIRTNVDSDFAITAEAYISWSGNLYSVLEMQFQVGIVQKISTPEQMKRILGDLPSTASRSFSS